MKFVLVYPGGLAVWDRSVASRMLRSWVLIPPESWMLGVLQAPTCATDRSPIQESPAECLCVSVCEQAKK